MPKFRLHVLGLAFTQSNKDWPSCAYTQKVVKFCKMMSQRGHDVTHYGNQGSIVDCPHVDILTEVERVAFCGERNKESTATRQKFWDVNSKLWRTFNGRCIAAMMPRVEKGDIICHCSGASIPISQAITNELVTNVENGIGYGGSWASFKCFESYMMQDTTWIRQRGGDAADIQEWDAVIPNYFDVADFPVGPGGDYLAFLATINIRKGLQYAINVARATGMALVAGGPGLRKIGNTPLGTKYQADDGMVYDTVGVDFEYVGHCDMDQRAKLLGGALATLVPTRYIEPFGGVSVESMLCGTPAIVADAGGLVDNVEDGRTGFRCRTPDQWIRAAKLAHTIDRAHTRQRAIDRFSLEKVGAMFDEWFMQIQDRWKATDPLNPGDGWSLADPTRTQLDWLS